MMRSWDTRTKGHCLVYVAGQAGLWDLRPKTLRETLQQWETHFHKVGTPGLDLHVKLTQTFIKHILLAGQTAERAQANGDQQGAAGVMS